MLELTRKSGQPRMFLHRSVCFWLAAMLDITLTLSGCARLPPPHTAIDGAPQAAAPHAAAPSPVLVSPTLGVLRYVPPGDFEMGATPPGYAGPVGSERPHAVRLTRGFWLMEHELTEGAWLALMGELPNGATPTDPRLPVTGMSWDDLTRLLDALEAKEGVRYRPPTEAEWELAARAGAPTLYAGSDHADEVAWHQANSGSRKHPVCQLRPNSLGFCDMSGNVLEWTSDWFSPQPGGPATDPTGPSSGGNRVARGGAFLYSPEMSNVAFRPKMGLPMYGHHTVGVRLARSADETVSTPPP